PNNKRKRVGKIKGKEKAHPYSRKARQISRAMNKESQIARTKEERVKVAMAHGQKQVWFRDRINEEDLLEQKSWTIEQLAKLVDDYLQRNDEEIEEIEAGRVKGRALAPKDSLFMQVTETEKKEAKLGGIEVPDLTSAFMVKTLRSWDGDVNSVSTIKLINCKPSDQQPKRRDMAAEKSAKSAEQAIAQVTGMVVG
ncbi:translation machinery-associated protein 16, partial [Coemansia sp. RSA 988]